MQYKIAIGLIAVSWVATSSLWMMQNKAPERDQDFHLREFIHDETNRFRRGENIVLSGEDASKAMRSAAITSIKAQLEAFRHEDYATGFQYQSEDLKRTLASVAKFRALVVSGYPQMAHYKSVSFRKHRVSDFGRLVIPAVVTGTDGKELNVVYYLVYERGKFHVAGIRRIQFMDRAI